MDLSDRARTFTGSQKRVLLAGFSDPAESALALGVNVRHVLHGRRHGDELLKVLFVGVCENAVGTVTLLMVILGVHVHLLIGVSDFLHSELDSTNFQDVSLFNFIVLSKRNYLIRRQLIRNKFKHRY